MSDNITLVPHFIIKLNGTRLSAEQEACVIQIVVNLRVNVKSTFAVTLSDIDRKWTNGDDFFIGVEVEIQLGYKDDYKTVMKGYVTGMKPRWCRHEPSTVEIIGNCGLVNMDRAKSMRGFNNKTDSEIVKEIVEANYLEVGKIDDFGFERKFTHFQRLTDYEYLLKLAQMYNIYFWCEGNKFFCKNNPDRGDEEIILESGKTLTDFDANEESRMLVSTIEVRSWDFHKWEPIVGIATYNDIAKADGEKTGAEVIEENFGEAKTVEIDTSIPDQRTAEEIARKILERELSNYVRGDGKTQGNANILAGTTIIIKGEGEKFSGKYFVKYVRHTLNPMKGFITEIYVTRSALGDISEGSSDDSGYKKAMAQPKNQKQEERVKQKKKEEQDEKFIEIQLNDENGEPASGERFKITLADGTTKTGTLDEDGYAKIEVDNPDKCEIEFPNLKDQEWET